MVGQTIGKYRVVSRLGRGGMGTVYKAVDETLGREVAIKSLHHDLSDPELLKRFRAEAVTLARMNHPNIATLFELTEHEGELLMVMEFVSGETFDKLSERTGPMQVMRAAQLCAQVLDALAHAHRAGIVHRDLKPANLMLAESGLVKVMDFGIARMAGTEHLTNDGFMMGTPAYMAPEQVLGGDVDGRADLYAIGVVFYRLLTAQLPFKADTGIAMVQKQINDLPTPVRQIRADLSAECEAVIAKALAKSPADRYQTADELKAALAELAFGGVQDRAKTTPPTSQRIPASIDMTMPPTLTPPIGLQSSAPSAPVAVPPASATPAQPVSAPPPAPAATKPASPAKAMAAAGVALVLLIGIPSAWMWRTSHRAPSVAAVEPAATAPAAVVPAAVVPAAVQPAAAEPAPSTPSTPNPSAAPVSAATTSPVKPAARPVTTEKRAETDPSARPVSPAPSVPAAAKASVAPLLFEDVKLLTFEGTKTREEDAILRLTADSLDVSEGGRRLSDAPYSSIVAVFHSHSREPRWQAPDGSAVSVAKVGGKFSFLKGEPDWITVRTKSAFIPLRMKSSSVAQAIAAIEQRTGVRVTRVER